MHDPRTRLRLQRVRAFRRGRYQGFDQLATEARDLGAAHVAADHSIGQARLERLVDDAPAPPEIRFATDDESIERNLLGLAAALSMEHPDLGGCIRQGLYLPDTLACIATVLFEDPGACRSQAGWEFAAEYVCAVVAMGVAAPTQMARPVEYLLDAHLEDDVGMCADPRALRRDLAKQRVERHTCFALMDRIDPDQDAIHREQFVPDRVGEGFVVDDGTGSDTNSGKCFEDGDEGAVLRGRVLTCGSISAGKDGNSLTERGMFGVHAQAPRRIACRAELGRKV